MMIEPQEKQKKRILMIALIMIALFSLLLAQFFNIQILEGDKWTNQANRQHFFVIKEPFLRGTFYSNTYLDRGNPDKPQKLIIDIEKFHLFIDPESIPDNHKNAIAEQLSEELEINNDSKKKLLSNLYKKSRSRKLAMWIERDTKESILRWWNPFSKKNRIPRNALFFTSDYQRSYPFGKLLGQVLHTVQNIREEATQQAIPTGGLELYFNDILKGKIGKRKLMRSPKNSLEIGEVITPPTNGADIHLTINHCLQAIVEEELEKGVKQTKSKSGWAVMLQPKTGEILALGHYPFFYPSEYQKFFNDPITAECTRAKAITDAHEPGSVIKPITIAIAMKANKILKQKKQKEIFDLEEKTPTSDSHFKGRKPLKDTHLHYFLNMEMAIQKSSNIYVARLAEKICERLGSQWYKQELHQTFGFGEKTNVELQCESRGLVPTPGKKHPNGTLEWSISTPYSLAMGHNMQCNAIQLARAYAVLANGGWLVEPTLVRKIVKLDKNGPQISLDNLKKKHSRIKKVLDTDITKKVVSAMKYTTKPGGTARKADVWGYTECGKTGTGQKVINGTYSQTQYCSTFVGFTPVEQPAFVLVVTMDEPEYGYIPGLGRNHMGGTSAAPVFREIARRSLEYLGITPDDPFGYPVGDPRCNLEKADWMPETRRLQEKYEKWNNSCNKNVEIKKQ